MKNRTRSAIAAIVAVPLVLGTASCSQDAGGDDGDITTIEIMGKPAATNTAALELFEKQVAEFEDLNPDIRIEASDVPWDAKTFVTRLAGGSAPTLLRVPLTEPPSLIERGQVADLSAELADVESFDALNPRVMEFLEEDGAVYGIPEKSYAFGLVYNRTLFEQAGLDPDAPPTTWDEVREAAKAITEKTGKVGFGEITTNNSGGWHLTGYTYTYGGSVIEQGSDGTWTASFNDEPTKDVLEWWKQMRWEDDSLGDNVLGKQEDLVAEFTAGNVGMWISAPPDVYPNYIASGGDPEAFGAGAMPQGGADATLAGATVLMVNAKATDAERAAAVKWMDYRALRPNYDTEVAAETAKASAADGLPVGVPVLPIFDDKTYASYTDAISEYVNVDVDHFASYVDSLGSLEYVAEPPVASQEIYAALDPLVQAILTDESADIDSLLDDAETRVNAILAQNAS
ncbi:ABC-type glycerol-3-phosphate transport system substrate-binding protein [Labedella gwakjiensis]|uniref:ABC-type glycerol-3-phosphate transport system substrate-binding protein n=1 Tax=Labedella gwakjiensis TaxID=390269 RepID=A0A2P8GUI0_9MICO|nr:extracellular solute-binding protein [Labedella gwakjiensis]PSL37616.1 ABC-type glycerol-3-phosphate transport system substrate-binding protein [Labedella gwakjiensis]RUQ81709.1 extracellular solute-binding protein [Labedella gwakjiensis]